jgi:hypothetical protein
MINVTFTGNGCTFQVHRSDEEIGRGKRTGGLYFGNSEKVCNKFHNSVVVTMRML